MVLKSPKQLHNILKNEDKVNPVNGDFFNTLNLITEHPVIYLFEYHYFKPLSDQIHHIPNPDIPKTCIPDLKFSLQHRSAQPIKTVQLSTSLWGRLNK